MRLGQFIVLVAAKETLFASQSYGMHHLTWESVVFSKWQTKQSMQTRVWKYWQALMNQSLISKTSIPAVPSEKVAQISTWEQDSTQPPIGDRGEIIWEWRMRREQNSSQPLIGNTGEIIWYWKMRREQESPQPPIGDRRESRHGGRVYMCFLIFTQLILQHILHTNTKSWLNSELSYLISHVRVLLEISRSKPFSDRVFQAWVVLKKLTPCLNPY